MEAGNYMSKKKSNFGQRMKEVKAKKVKAAKDKALTDQFPPLPPEKMEKVFRLDLTSPVKETLIDVRPQENHIERAVRHLREQSRNI